MRRRVAVVSHDLWSARFGSDAALVGSQLTLDGVPVTVVGVMPPRFFDSRARRRRCGRRCRSSVRATTIAVRYLRVLARLAPGTTLDEAHAQANVVAARLARDYPATNGPWIDEHRWRCRR